MDQKLTAGVAGGEALSIIPHPHRIFTSQRTNAERANEKAESRAVASKVAAFRRGCETSRPIRHASESQSGSHKDVMASITDSLSKVHGNPLKSILC